MLIICYMVVTDCTYVYVADGDAHSGEDDDGYSFCP